MFLRRLNGESNKKNQNFEHDIEGHFMIQYINLQHHVIQAMT